jgi:ABC-type amino acid transport substrate-binding protein
VLVRGYIHEVVIACAADEIARHPRSYERIALRENGTYEQLYRKWFGIE